MLNQEIYRNKPTDQKKKLIKKTRQKKSVKCKILNTIYVYKASTDYNSIWFQLISY